MKTVIVKAVIKNVTGDSFNDACIRELNRSGVPVGAIISGLYSPQNKAIDFKAPNGDDAVAWVGSTCEIIEEKTKELSKLKKGEFFRLKDSESAPVWVRGEYITSERKYSTHKYEDTNHEKLIKGTTKVFVDFTY